MIRATTGGVLRSYRYNLMNSFITDNKARETVLSQRVFNSYAEDPAAAAKAFRLRKSRLMTSSQLKICDDVYHKYQGAFASLQTVSQLIDTENSSSNVSTLKSTTLEMLNDPTGDARTQLRKVLDQLSDTIVQNMNQKYGDEFIFAGADGYNVPFTVEEVDGKKQLLYRGIPVDAAEPKLMTDEAGNRLEVTIEKADGTTPPADDDDTTYLREGTELMDVSAVPELEQDANGKPPITVNGVDGKIYYVLRDADPPVTEADLRDELTNQGLTGTALEDALEAKKAEYIETYEFVGPDPENPLSYYKPEDLILKDEYNKINDSIMRDENGDPYTVVIDNYDEDGNYVDSTTNYIVAGQSDPFVTDSEYEKACADTKKLEYLANEKRFVDIGLGFQEDEDGKLIESSAFNECLNGLTFLGYGLDEDGDPKNIYSIVQRLTEIADSVPEEGKWSEEVYDEFDRLVGKLENASSEFKTQFTNQSAATEKLKNNYELLEDNVYSLKEQYSNLEDVNMADAITSFIWAEYCYNAALKVGNSILSQSLMDYLQ